MSKLKKTSKQAAESKGDDKPLSSQDLKLLVDFFGLLYEWDCKQKKDDDALQKLKK